MHTLAAESPREPPPKRRSFTTTVSVRWSDLDLLGHVNNARVMTLLEESAVDFHAAIGGDTPDVLPAIGRVVGRWEVDYHRPLRHCPAQISIEVVRVGRSSYRLRHTVSQGEGTAVTAVCTLVRIGADEQSQPLSPTEREVLSRHLTGGAMPAHGVPEPPAVPTVET